MVKTEKKMSKTGVEKEKKKREGRAGGIVDLREREKKN